MRIKCSVSSVSLQRSMSIYSFASYLYTGDWAMVAAIVVVNISSIVDQATRSVHSYVMAPKKKVRWDELALLRSTVPFISQSALSSILAFAAKENLPTIKTRRAVRQARDSFVATPTPYGPLHTRLQIAGNVSTEIQNPFGILHYVCRHSASFSSMVARTFAEHPVTPANQWTIVLYADEISPGNQLAYKHERKSWAIYWSFAEFGPYLSQEDLYTRTI